MPSACPSWMMYGSSRDFSFSSLLLYYSRFSSNFLFLVAYQRTPELCLQCILRPDPSPCHRGVSSFQPKLSLHLKIGLALSQWPGGQPIRWGVGWVPRPRHPCELRFHTLAGPLLGPHADKHVMLSWYINRLLSREYLKTKHIFKILAEKFGPRIPERSIPQRTCYDVIMIYNHSK